VIEINPDRWQAFHYKGVCIVKQKEYDRALKVFEEGRKLFPGQPRFYIDEALAYVMKRDLDIARAKLREAISIDPSFKTEINATPEFTGLL
jgi:tetratricopeptide (TPR) repeat protein